MVQKDQIEINQRADVLLKVITASFVIQKNLYKKKLVQRKRYCKLTNEPLKPNDFRADVLLKKVNYC